MIEETAEQTPAGALNEETPLLNSNGDFATLSSTDLKKRLKSPYLIFPVVFGVHAATSIITTTAVDVLRKLSCQFWYFFNDPESFPSDGNFPDDLCHVPGVEKLFATVFNVNTIIESVGALITFALIGKYANLYGRRPSLLVLGLIPVLSTAAFISAVLIRNTMAQVLLLSIYVLLAALANAKATVLLGTMYIVDTTVGPADRTASLTFMTASALGALTPGYALGGIVTQWSHNAVSVFFISLLISILALLYTFFFIPETFTSPSLDAEHNLVPARSLLPNIARSLAAFFHPFLHLKPKRNSNGRRNYRLLTLAAVAFFAYGAAAYVLPAFLLYSTTSLHLKADETGTILSMTTFSKVVFMIFVLPGILTFRPRFSKWLAPSTSTGSREDTSRDLRTSPSTQFDAVILFLSLLMDSLSVSGLALAASKTQATFGKLSLLLQWEQMFIFSRYPAMIMLAFGAGAQPTLQSMIAASCEPTKSGEVLSAMQIIVGISELVSVMGLGAVMTATISTIPTLVFWLAAGLLWLAGGLLMLVRDSDRWNPA